MHALFIAVGVVFAFVAIYFAYQATVHSMAAQFAHHCNRNGLTRTKCGQQISVNFTIHTSRPRRLACRFASNYSLIKHFTWDDNYVDYSDVAMHRAFGLFNEFCGKLTLAELHEQAYDKLAEIRQTVIAEFESRGIAIDVLEVNLTLPSVPVEQQPITKPTQAELLQKEIDELEAVKELLTKRAQLRSEIDAAIVKAGGEVHKAIATVDSDVDAIDTEAEARRIRTIGQAINEVAAGATPPTA